MIIFKNRKNIFTTNDSTELFNYMAKYINISNFKFLTENMIQIISEFIEENEKISLTDAKRLFSKLFNTHTSKNINYWTVRGWTENEAVEQISIASKKSSLAATEKIQMMKNDKKIWDKFKATKPTTIEYYINKGMQYSDAVKALSKRQATFSKKKMIDVHGEEEGLKKIKERNKKWFTTLKNNNDWDELSQRKAITLEKMISKYGEEEGIEKYHNWKESVAQTKENFIKRHGNILGEEKWELFKNNFIQNYHRPSNESILFFSQILNELKFLIDESEIYIAINGKNEYWLKDNDKTYFYDLTIRNLNLIIEYHGTHIHPNPKWDNEKWNSWKHAFQNKDAVTAREFDLKKKSLAESQGFTVLEIWNDDNFETNQKFIMSEIKKRL